MSRERLMSSVGVSCLVVTWMTVSVTNLTVSIRASGTVPSGNSTVNSVFLSHVPLYLVVDFFL